MAKTKMHSATSSTNCIVWPPKIRPSIEGGEPREVDPRYYLDRGYIAYKGAWYLPWELSWWTRHLLRKLRKRGVQAVFLDPNIFK